MAETNGCTSQMLKNGTKFQPFLLTPFLPAHKCTFLSYILDKVKLQKNKT